MVIRHIEVDEDVNALFSNLMFLNHFTPAGAKSKPDKFSKIANWIKLKNKQQTATHQITAQHVSIESKVRELCITHGFTLGVKGLNGA